MGYLTLRPEQSNIFFKLMEERYRRRASIITTNLLCSALHKRFNAERIVMRSRVEGPTLAHSLKGEFALL